MSLERLIALSLLALVVVLAGCQAAPTATPVPTVEPTATPAPTTVAESAPPTLPVEQPTPAPTVNPNVDAAVESLDLPDEGPAAHVNGEPIPMARFEEFLHLRLNVLAQRTPIDWSAESSRAALEQTAKQVLEQLVDMEMIRQQAKEADKLPTEAEIDELQEEIKGQVLGQEPTDEAWQTYLDEQGVSAETFRRLVEESIVLQTMMDEHALTEPVEHVHAQHILVEDMETAQELQEQLAEGADFGELAQEHSQDPGSAQEGGDLGWFPRGVMDPAFEESTFGLEAGEISEPISTTYGVHLIKVLEKDTRPIEPPYDQYLSSQAFEAWLTELRAETDVERHVLVES